MNDAPTSIIYNLPVPADENRQIKIGFKAKDTSKHNQEITVRISVKAASDTAPINPNDFKLVVELSTSQLFLQYMEWAVIIIIMLVMMGGLLLYNPKKRRMEEKPPKEKDKEATHGAVARQ